MKASTICSLLVIGSITLINITDRGHRLSIPIGVLGLSGMAFFMYQEHKRRN
ncbi:hypothetical protein [Lacticaseibacillus daqingensis]|uniref:hypothetical protein n=1 Tax=Lacticaseibacillus daqingensis TaxID=2486014 RepID=UPI0013DE7598|nr:hypothetical protein [Lacticaseibacillus daqingensis]